MAQGNDILDAIGGVKAEITDIKVNMANLLRRMDRVTTILEDISLKVGQTQSSREKDEIAKVVEELMLENVKDVGAKRRKISSDGHVPCAVGPSQLRRIEPYDEGFVRVEEMSNEEIYLLDVVRPDIGIIEMETMGCNVLHKEYDDRKVKHVNELGVLSMNSIHKLGQYTLSMPIPSEDHGIVLKYLSNGKLGQDEVVVETRLNYLTRQQMSTLEPGRWVMGEIINVLSEMFTIIERKGAANGARTWFMQSRLVHDQYGDDEVILGFIGRMKIKENFMGNLEKCERIFILVCERSHWLLLVVRIPLETVEIWDSKLLDGYSTGISIVDKVMRILDGVFNVDICETNPVGWSFRKFAVKIKVVPQQRNDYDCGVYVINFMEGRSFDEMDAKEFNSVDERARICCNLVLSDHNKQKDRILSNGKTQSRLEFSVPHQTYRPPLAGHRELNVLKDTYFGRRKC